jgi:tRNA(fMet)-specific endonuclease VapC
MADPQSRYVLDTNTISYLLRGNPSIIEGMQEAVLEGAEFYLCPVVWFEIRRGLLHRDAHRQLQVFERFAATLQWEDLDRPFWEDLSASWADLRRKGRPVQDADLMIAVFARRLGATVVTHNTSDFTFTGVPAVDWYR